MINFKLWIRAVRAPFFTATIIPVALGSAIAWHDTGAFLWLRFLLTMAGAIFIHMGTNLANDYFDHVYGCDEANPNPTPFSGGSRVIQEGLISAKKILAASLSSFALGGAIGVYLNYVCDGNIILIMGIIGICLGFFYTIKPLRIGYGGFGELAIGIGFGPLMVLGAYYVQAQAMPFKAFLVSIPIGILIALVVFINEFPDCAADRSVSKMTLVVLLGKKNAIKLYHLLLAVIYILIVSFLIFKVIPAACLLTLLSLPLAVKAFNISKKNYARTPELLPANSFTIGLHSLIGLLLCIGFILNKVI